MPSVLQQIDGATNMDQVRQILNKTDTHDFRFASRRTRRRWCKAVDKWSQPAPAPNNEPAKLTRNQRKQARKMSLNGHQGGRGVVRNNQVWPQK